MANGYGTRNMGRGTSRFAGSRQADYQFYSGGMPIRKHCLGCGQPKRSNESHPKCSRKLQKMRERGEL